MNRRVGEKVILNVYDLNPQNDYLYGFGLGMYHSGVEVHGTEYTFASEAGVFHHSPKDTGSGAKFRESIVLGEVMMGSRDVENIANSLKSDFPGDSYNLLTQNCNCFSQAFVRKLINKDIPGYVNRMANIGSMCSCCLPPEMTGNAPVKSSSSSSASFGMTKPAPTSNFKAFGGSGISLSSRPNNGYSKVNSDDPSERREMLMKAAAARLNKQNED